MLLSAGSAAAFGQAASASNGGQNQAPPPIKASSSETDIGVSAYQAMNSSTTANGVTQKPVNAVGGMFEVRHIQSPWIGYEVTYSYNSGKQTIGPAPAPGCGIYCPLKPQTLSSVESLVGLDWVVSKQFGSLRPFAAGGVGFLIDEPGRTTYGVVDVVRPSWLYGGGVDWKFMSHLGIRLQYRGLIYKVPNLSTLFPAQGVYTQSREPMGGIFYSF